MNREETLKKIIKKVLTGKIDSSKRAIKFDFKANIKWEAIDGGKIILIHDVPIAKEMVQPYHDGIHYKTAEAIDNISVQFSPISISHPDKHFKDMSREEQIELTIGYLANGVTRDSKKYADLYLFSDKTPDEVMDKIENNNSIDVSIGFFVDIDETPGEFQGEHFDKKQTNIALDHLALLPNETGRASFPDGVGVGADNKQDEVYNMESAKALENALQAKVDMESKLKDSERNVKDLNDKAAKLEDEAKKTAEFKDKAAKYDALLKKQEDDKAEEITQLKDKILKHEKSPKDEKFKKFIECQDKKESLEFVLNDLDTKMNGMPPTKKDGQTPGEHPSDAYAKKKYQDKNKVQMMVD